MAKFGETALKVARIPDPGARLVPGLENLGFGWSQLDDETTLLFKRLFLLPDENLIAEAGIEEGLLTASIAKYLGKRGGEYYDLLRWMIAITGLRPGVEMKTGEEQYASATNFVDLWQEMNNLFQHSLEPFDFISLYILSTYNPPEDPDRIIIAPVYDEFFRTVAPEQQYPSFTTVDEIDARIRDDIKTLITIQINQLKNILEMQANLEPDPYGRNYYLSTYRVIEATYSAQIAPIQSPLVFLNYLIVSDTIPLVVYIASTGEIYAKRYKYTLIPVPTEKELKKNLTEGNKLVLQIQVNGKALIINIDLKTNILSFESRDTNLDYVLQILSTTGINVRKEDLRRSRFNGLITMEHSPNLSDNIRDPVINRRSFLYTMLTDRRFSSLIQLNEQKRSNFFRNEIIMSYRPFSYVMSGAVVDKSQEITLRLKLSQAAVGKVVFQVEDVKSESSINSLRIVLGRLLYIYQANNKDSLESEFKKFLGPELEIKEEFTSKELRDVAPGVFNSQFFGLRPKEGRPRIISYDELQPGKQYTRVLVAGYDIILTNSNASYPYFGIKKMPAGAGLSYVPWYFKKPQMGGNISSTFNDVIGTTGVSKEVKRAKKTSFESHPIQHGGVGVVAPILKEFLEAIPVGQPPGYLFSSEETIRKLTGWEVIPRVNIQVVRRGVQGTIPGHGNSAMLNATYVATLHDPFAVEGRSSRGWLGIRKKFNVLDFFTSDMAADITSYRKNMPNIKDGGGVNVARQELYDYTPEQIVKQFTNTSMPIGPEFIRIYEEMFDINIFMFSIEPISGKVKVKLPRHTHSYINFYHPRSSRDPNQERQCILLYENRGNIDIITLDIGGRIFTKFGSEIGARIHDVIYRQLNERILVVTDDQRADIKDSKGNPVTSFTLTASPVGVSAYDMNYDFLWESKTPLGVIYQQMIDKYGKRYGVILARQRGGNTEFITIYHPPQQPLNVGLARGDIPYEDPGLGVGLVPIGLNSKGAWYSVFGLKKGFFVSLTRTGVAAAMANFKGRSVESYIMEVPATFSNTERQLGLGKRTQLVQSTSHTLKQIFNWLFTLSGEPVDTFVSKYFVADTRQVDDSQRYDFSKLPLHPPDVKEVKSAIEWLAQNTGGLINNGLIQVPSALLQKLPAFLSSVQKGSVIQFNEPFKHPDDFIQRTSATILVGTDNYNSWVKNNGSSLDTYDIPLLDKLPRTNVPTRCVVKFNVEGRSVIYLALPLAPKLSDSLNIIRTWNFIKPDEKLNYLIVESTDKYINIQQNETNKLPVRYYIILSHQDKNMFSLLVPLQN